MTQLICKVLFLISMMISSLYAQVKLDNNVELPVGIKRTLIVNNKSGAMVHSSWRLSIRFLMRTDSGFVIDSSKDKPYAFIVNEGEGLKGWDICLSSMKVGDSAYFVIPPTLAYGDKRVGKIKPGSPIHFYVKVLKQEPVYFDQGRVYDTLVLAPGLKKVIHVAGKAPLVSKYKYVCVNFTGFIKTKEGYRRIFETASSAHQVVCFQLGVGKFLTGLDIAFSTMQPGEKSTIVLAPEWGYKDKENGLIPPNSVLYYDVEMVREYSPFEIILSKDTIRTDNGVKMVFDAGSKTDTFGLEKVMRCDMVLFYLNADGGKVIISDSKLNGRLLNLPYSSKVLSPLIINNLHLLSANARGLIIIPATKAEEWVVKKGVPAGKDVFVEVSNVAFIPYPFFNSTQVSKIEVKDGVYYFPIRAGEKAVYSLKEGDQVDFVYTGYYFKEGQRYIFSTSRETSQALTYVVGEKKIIPGLICGLEGMTKGECRKIYIPYQQGYGEKGIEGAGIPPRTDLYFDIEVINIRHN